MCQTIQDAKVRPDEPQLRAEPEVVPVPAEAPELPRIRRSFRIEMRDLREHGYTRNCPKCDAIRAGTAVSTAHSVECRERFRNIFLEADDNRVERAEARRAADGAHGPIPEPSAGTEAAPFVL